ncbi:MAG: anaerobic ribonucleoside-triphosphate reductase activating protein [Oscillospiraceae bacterium]|jgi:anaerobic ribonucleoside-triphosphate reductase activating protein|nr:anaerobic ribonucleoside-triphosphate reductase activating protein [Oscillospiraceae bacterium]
MRVAGTVQDSIVDGPGFRYVVFAQGCPHRCEGCHNPETREPDGGTWRDVAGIIREMLSNPLTDGLTLSGGEPFAQARDCAELAEAARNAGLNVWTYSGYTFEELLAKSASEPDALRLLAATDILVDGRFVLSERSLDLAFRGSRNQRVLDAKRSLASGAAVERG